MVELVAKLFNQDYSYQSFTHERHLAAEVFDSCIFSHCDMNFSFFRNKIFISCDFRHADIGGTEFQDCEFINCAFEYTNLTNACFLGCVIKNDKRYFFVNNEKVYVGIFRSSSSNITFSSSDNKRTKLINTKLKDIGLRECSISDTDIFGVNFNSISLEDSKLQNCSFDKLNLMSNNVKGMTISSCNIEKIEITFEKLINIIGVEFIVNCKNIKVHLNSRGDSFYTDKIGGEFLSFISTSKQSIINTGGIFEYVNLSILESIIIGETFNSDFIEKAIDDFSDESTGKPISPHNFLSLMELIIYYGINSPSIYRKLKALANFVIQYRMNEKQKALIFFKLEKLTQINIETHVAIEVIDRSSSFNLESRQALAEFSFKLLTLSEIKDSNVLSQRTGSVIEQILIQTKELIENFWQLTLLLSLLGFKFKKEFNNGAIIEFSLVPSMIDKKRNNKKLSLSNIDQEEINKRLSDNNFKPSGRSSQRSLSIEELKIVEDLRALIRQKEIHISIKRAAIKEVMSNENIRAILMKK
ncbi:MULTISPECIES: pentapeptide repeat-containing protein [Pseudoalteromonas]|uniref:pentapeptide repeat-containing protein n=1 Tax=Pseudoalteromonas TaxID=53246 RepID=UPI00029B0366|nr:MULTISPECIES: pentapeptide repeat-containing protein [Pseudoalteromonas]MCG7556359.1 pentapeptide repeat-containing protein [Pseudoalteromonas sp. Of11M-6]